MWLSDRTRNIFLSPKANLEKTFVHEIDDRDNGLQ